MSALKEFANFITQNRTILAKSYARLLAESGRGYDAFSQDSRLAVARKLLNGVVSACEAGKFDPVIALFEDSDGRQRWGVQSVPLHPLAEIECLGQTLTPVVTNLDAGKFLWQMLAEIRLLISGSGQPPSPPISIAAGEHKDEGRKSLSPTEQNYRELVDSLPVGVYRSVAGPQGHFLEVNQAIVTMFEADSKEQLLRHKVSDLYQDPADRQKISDKLLGHPKEEILKLKTLKGKEIWGAVTSVPRQDKNGQIYFDGIIEDVTKRKQAEDALWERDKQLRLLLDSAPDPIVMYDDVGNTIYVNPAFEQTFGWSQQELLGKRMDFVPEESVAETRDALERLFNEGRVLQFETKRLTKSGQILEVEQSGSVFRDETGNIKGSIIFVRDISIRKQAQAVLARRAAQLETVAEVSNAVSTILNPDQLLQTVADLTKEHFGLYHSHIYVLDKENDRLNLVAGAGEVGRQMVAQGWHIPLHQEASIVARAARNQKALVVNSVRNKAGFFPNPLLPHTQAEMAVPMMVGDRVLGVLDVQSDQLDYFTQEDVRVQTILAAQIAIALQNARQYDQTQTALSEVQASQEELTDYSQRLQQLQKITQNLAREPKPGSDVYRNTIGAVAKLLRARYAALALLDEHGNYLQFIHYGISAEQAELIGDLPRGRGLLGVLLQAEEPIRLKDMQTDPRSAGFPEHHPQMKSLLGLPIIFQDRVLGRLYFTEAESGEFGAEDEALANSFATSLAGTLQIVNLFSQTEAAHRQSERQAAEIGILGDVSQTLISEPDLDIALHVVTNVMVESFGATFARLWTLDDTGQMLLLKASSGLYTHLDGGHAQVPVGKFKIGLIAEERQAHLTNNILNDPRLGDPAWAKREGMVAFAGYPLLAGDRLIGVLAMFARQPLPDEVLNILGRLADRAAVAIDNRRLLEETRQQANFERLVGEISEKLRQAPNLEALAKTAGQELSRALGVSHSIVKVGGMLKEQNLDSLPQNGHQD